ncbi:hypothetical protein VZT92_002983 [Zoarces viviparus]|uniref:Uncharacterized protein n=1 Tax=Zoarces viviparus TaxID=48416 RepID=A0AAW1G170_ZOAVI
MPVVISSRISVNCHPVTGRLHVGHRRPLLPTGLTGSVHDQLSVTRNWESANPAERLAVWLPLWATYHHITEPRHQHQARPGG